MLLGVFIFFAFFGGAMVALLEKLFNYKCPNILVRAAFGITISVVFLACAGLVVAVVPVNFKQPMTIVILLLLLLWGVIGTFRFNTFFALTGASRAEIIVLAGYVLFSTLCLLLSCSNPNMPANLPDGPYVSKEWTRGVKIQFMTGSLPLDNVLPFEVSEYFLRGISFQDNHPVMPGQEVTNRPVLAAAIVTPFIAAIAPPDSTGNTLPTFSYVGTQWPDFRVLVRDDRACTVYLAVMIALNAALLLGVAAFFNSLAKLKVGTAVIATLLFVTSPYFVFQTIFTWPKELAAFFVLLALTMAVTSKGRQLLVGLLLGLAYLSHPYAGAFLLGFGLFYLMKNKIKNSYREVITLGIGFFLVTLPWFLWKIHLHLPSDLVSQNFHIAGQSHFDFIWARITNLLSTFLPVHLLAYPFNLSGVLIGSTVNVAGAVGLLVYGLVLFHCSDFFSLKNWTHLTVMIGMPCLLLVLVFSNQAVPALHGLQVLVPLLVFGVSLRLEKYGRLLRTAILGSQVIVNVVLFSLYLISIGIIHGSR
jgi:hypothetical protein